MRNESKEKKRLSEIEEKERGEEDLVSHDCAFAWHVRIPLTAFASSELHCPSSALASSIDALDGMTRTLFTLARLSKVMFLLYSFPSPRLISIERSLPSTSAETAFWASPLMNTSMVTVRTFWYQSTRNGSFFSRGRRGCCAGSCFFACSVLVDEAHSLLAQGASRCCTASFAVHGSSGVGSLSCSLNSALLSVAINTHLASSSATWTRSFLSISAIDFRAQRLPCSVAIFLNDRYELI